MQYLGNPVSIKPSVFKGINYPLMKVDIVGPPPSTCIYCSRESIPGVGGLFHAMPNDKAYIVCVVYFSCFLSLLLLAAILYKVKYRYDLYRRHHVRNPLYSHAKM